MGSINSVGVYEFDVTDNQFGPVLLNRLSASLTAIFNAATNVVIKRVADTTARGVYRTAFGTPTVGNPCVVYRADAVAGMQLEIDTGSGFAAWLTRTPPIRTVFTATGSYTPTVGMIYVDVQVVAPGGGGGGVNAASSGQHARGGGGGGGGWAQAIMSAATIGAGPVTITIGAIGAGGVGGVGAAGGGTGGNASFGALLTTTGGTGGSVGATTSVAYGTTGGVGGTYGGTASPLNGANGSPGAFGFGSGQLGASGGGGAGGNGSGGGVGRNSAAVNSSQSGAAATGYGGGGGGALTTSLGAGQAGGNGAPGLVIVTEYF